MNHEILVNGENNGIPNWVVLHPQKKQQIIRNDKITAHMAQNGFVSIEIEMNTYVVQKDAQLLWEFRVPWIKPPNPGFTNIFYP